MNPLMDPLTGQMFVNSQKKEVKPHKLDRSEVSFSQVYDKEADKAFKSDKEKFQEDIEDFKKDISTKSLQELKDLRSKIIEDISKFLKKGKTQDLKLAQEKFDACKDEIRKRVSGVSYTPVNNNKLAYSNNTSYNIKYTVGGNNKKNINTTPINNQQLNTSQVNTSQVNTSQSNNKVSFNSNSIKVNSSLPPEIQAQQLMANINNSSKYNVMYSNFLNGSLNINTINDLSALSGESEKKENDILGF